MITFSSEALVEILRSSVLLCQYSSCSWRDSVLKSPHESFGVFPLHVNTVKSPLSFHTRSPHRNIALRISIHVIVLLRRQLNKENGPT